jgi:hypothetical protein
MENYSRWHDNKGSDGWADEALDFLFSHELCDKAMAWALGVKAEYDADYMQRVFESLPEYKNGRNITQEEIAESYIEFFELVEQFDREWEEKNGGRKNG